MCVIVAYRYMQFVRSKNTWYLHVYDETSRRIVCDNPPSVFTIIVFLVNHHWFSQMLLGRCKLNGCDAHLLLRVKLCELSRTISIYALVHKTHAQSFALCNNCIVPCWAPPTCKDDNSYNPIITKESWNVRFFTQIVF